MFAFCWASPNGLATRERTTDPPGQRTGRGLASRLRRESKPGQTENLGPTPASPSAGSRRGGRSRSRCGSGPGLTDGEPTTRLGQPARIRAAPLLPREQGFGPGSFHGAVGAPRLGRLGKGHERKLVTKIIFPRPTASASKVLAPLGPLSPALRFAHPGTPPTKDSGTGAI